MRGRRRRRRRARPRRRRRQRQCRPRRGAPRRPSSRRRTTSTQLLDRTGARAAADGLAIELRTRRRRGPPVRRRHVRRRALDVRRDVHAAAGGRRGRAAAGVPAGRPHRPRQLDPDRIRRADVHASSVGYVPPPAGLRSPLEWGTPSRLHELLGRGVSSLDVTPRTFVFRYRSARHWLDAFRTQYGPVLKAFAALDPPAATRSTPTSRPRHRPRHVDHRRRCASPASTSRSSPSGGREHRASGHPAFAESASRAFSIVPS